MIVQVNGDQRRLEAGATVASLLASLGLASGGVAVAVDRRVIPRSEHARTLLTDGAVVEILRAVGGG
ncbi:MAG TPA: sulfur carrier protein ThiS [Deltaproteobacteria bacterium]|nr:sulfur carrier protein ThiS [Deltaproteobacteria bacterium]